MGSKMGRKPLPLTEEERRERKRRKQREWRANNKDKMKEYSRRYRERHPEKQREYTRRYYEKNKERIKAYHKQPYVRERHNRRLRGRYNKDPEFKERMLNYWKKWYSKNKMKRRGGTYNTSPYVGGLECGVCGFHMKTFTGGRFGRKSVIRCPNCRAEQRKMDLRRIEIPRYIAVIPVDEMPNLEKTPQDPKTFSEEKAPTLQPPTLDRKEDGIRDVREEARYKFDGKCPDCGKPVKEEPEETRNNKWQKRKFYVDCSCGYSADGYERKERKERIGTYWAKMIREDYPRKIIVWETREREVVNT